MQPLVIHPSLKFIKAGYLLCLAAAIVVAGVAMSSEAPAAIVPAGLVLFLLPAIRHIRRQFTRMSIEGDKLRYETGFLSKSTRTIQLTKVQDVRVDQSLGQRILGVGNLSIETAGETSRLTIHNIDGPQAVADSIMDAAQRGSVQGQGA